MRGIMMAKKKPVNEVDAEDFEVSDESAFKIGKIYAPTKSKETQVIEGIHHRPALVKSLFQLSHMFRLACLKMPRGGSGLG